MNRTARAAALFLFLFCVFPAFAEETLSDRAFLLKKADEALARSDRKTADFYVARYLGLCSHDKTEACLPSALEPFLKKRKLEPKGFLPGTWSSSFLEWFENSIHERWGVPTERIREKARSFEIAQSTYEDKYVVTAVAYPELEMWYVLKEGLVSRPMLLATASYRDHPTLFFGRTLSGSTAQINSIFLDTQKRKLHYFWKPEFYDVDQDGIPELWIRFNLTWGNGFSQVLEVYKIRQNGKLELFHHFQYGANGYARRLEDGSVEVAGSTRPSSDSYHTETWIFEKKEFKKSAESNIPVPKSPDWPSTA